MDLGLKNKKVLITGSGRGIGLGIAKAFAEEGCKVLLNSRSEAQSGFPHVKADVSTAEGIELLKEAVRTQFQDKIDILVCNVGSGRSVPPGTEKIQDWQTSFNANFFSTTNVVEGLRSKVVSGGSILCISSICGLEQFGAPLTYSAAKAALNSYVVGLSRVIAKDSVRINAIAPGNILFEGSVWEKKLQENPGSVKDMLDKEVALKKLGSIEDVSNLALFLASQRAAFITGTIVVVDGGQVRSW